MLLLLGLLLLSACGDVRDQAGPAITHLLFNGANQSKAVALDGSTVSGTITIRLENESGIRKASFFLDSPEVRKDPVHVDYSAPFVYELDTTEIPNGSHELTVVATLDDHLHMVANSEFEIANSPTQPANQAPVVSAGNAQEVTLPNSASLVGTASDDGKPNGTLSYRWQKKAGPGAVTFSNPTQLETTASFSEPGSYTLALSASDGERTARAEVTVTVNAATPEPTPPPKTHWQPRPGLTWFWQLSGDIDMNQDVDVYDIDYQTSAQVVETLHKQGKKVIAYVPVGDWEPYRPDSGDFPEAALCGKIDGWPERYIDIRHPKAVELIKARIALAAAKGFDGIEGDVVDLHLNDTGCSPKITETEMTAYLKELAAYAHSLGLAYFAKNVVENAADWSQFTDGVVVEEAYQYNEAAGYMPYINANKPVFAAEYGSSHPTAAECADANARGYALYGTNLSLTGRVYKTCW